MCSDCDRPCVGRRDGACDERRVALDWHSICFVTHRPQGNCEGELARLLLPSIASSMPLSGSSRAQTCWIKARWKTVPELLAFLSHFAFAFAQCVQAIVIRCPSVAGSDEGGIFVCRGYVAGNAEV